MSKKWVAYTSEEGYWPFTSSETQKEAGDKMIGAIADRSILCIPIDNPIYILSQQIDKA